MNKVQILVIEDDIAVGNLITTTLEMENYQFRLAKTAKRGILFLHFTKKIQKTKRFCKII